MDYDPSNRHADSATSAELSLTDQHLDLLWIIDISDAVSRGCNPLRSNKGAAAEVCINGFVDARREKRNGPWIRPLRSLCS
jgi:hypothetical protein